MQPCWFELGLGLHRIRHTLRPPRSWPWRRMLELGVTRGVARPGAASKVAQKEVALMAAAIQLINYSYSCCAQVPLRSTTTGS